ncbi:hypothetical protein [Nonomuraea roseoviolacea]|uniref:hypothetical protein n=1 Tax=Nonomuraea roseoviolacea TaxID=103837 RepID=UPI0031DB4F8B
MIMILMLTGCAVNEPTINETQALVRVDQLVHETAAALDPKPRLEVIPHSLPTSACLDPDKPAGQVIVNRKYWLRGLPADQNMNIARQVRSHWEREGHTILSVGGWDAGHPSIGGLSKPDGFLLALVWSEGDDLYLAATSPCIWPSGSPPPDAA